MGSRGKQPTPAADRFAGKFEYDTIGGCWLWNSHRNHHGYGLLWISGNTQVKAHRLSWEVHRGPIPLGKNVLHHCDVTACVNPDHLYLGDQRDNMRDRSKRGRARTGHANAILTRELVQQIRSSPESHRVWAKRLEVSDTTINGVRSGRQWKCVEMIDQPRRDVPVLRAVLSALLHGPRTFREVATEVGITTVAVHGHSHKGRAKGYIESNGKHLSLTQAGKEFLA